MTEVHASRQFTEPSNQQGLQGLSKSTTTTPTTAIHVSAVCMITMRQLKWRQLYSPIFAWTSDFILQPIPPKQCYTTAQVNSLKFYYNCAQSDDCMCTRHCFHCCCYNYYYYYYRQNYLQALQKQLKRSRCLLGCGTQVDLMNHILDGVQILMRRCNFEGKRGGPLKSIRTLAMSCAKTAEPIEMTFGMWTWVGQGTMY